MILLDCNNAALGSILFIIKNIVNLIWIVGPILAIVSLAVNLTLLVKDPEDKKLPKKIKNSLDDNLKIMFNFSYENFLSKESEQESKEYSLEKGKYIEQRNYSGEKF